MMAGVIVFVFVLSEIWKRATFRYIQDARRQRQLMLIRRVVVGRHRPDHRDRQRGERIRHHWPPSRD